MKFAKALGMFAVSIILAITNTLILQYGLNGFLALYTKIVLPFKHVLFITFLQYFFTKSDVLTQINIKRKILGTETWAEDVVGQIFLQLFGLFLFWAVL